MSLLVKRVSSCWCSDPAPPRLTEGDVMQRLGGLERWWPSIGLRDAACARGPQPRRSNRVDQDVGACTQVIFESRAIYSHEWYRARPNRPDP